MVEIDAVLDGIKCMSEFHGVGLGRAAVHVVVPHAGRAWPNEYVSMPDA